MVSHLIKRSLVIVLSLVATNLAGYNPASTQYVQQNGGGGSSPSAPTYTIGQYAQGGVIFWTTLDAQHGLVASIVDMAGVSGHTNQQQWSPSGDYYTIGATGNDLSIGLDITPTTTGKINSALIVAHYGVYDASSNAYAAGVCASYSHEGYQDWYLPSLAELGLMMSKQSIINATSAAHGGAALQPEVYWSSFEYYTAVAWIQDFSNANQGGFTKDSWLRVRAVRAF